ncbi:UDP-N-acetylmuramate--L-alanine ligase [soil metagenome]
MSGSPARPAPLAPGARVHLVAIGGAGMSALGWILLQRGHTVSGSDLRGGRSCAALSAMGATVHVGHDAAHVGDADVVVVSTAVPAGNPEVRRAGELGLPVLHRAEMLAALMAGRRPLLVAGTHGKTTTTSMTTVCLQAEGLDPSFAIGGSLHGSGTSAHHGTGDVFVAEADESDGSFIVYRASCAIVTNVEMDHHDRYESLRDVQDAFVEFLARREGGAPAIVCLDDVGVRAIRPRLSGEVLTYGESADARLRVTARTPERSGSAFHLELDDADLGVFRVRLPGRHNVLNAAAATAAALWGGAQPDAIRAGLDTFAGAQRRFQRLGEAAGVTVVDDYGHHPTELRAVIEAARQAHPDGRVVVVFQPHRFTRTVALGGELGLALAGADVAVVTDVYAAGEAPVPGVTGALVADAAASLLPDTHYVPLLGDAADVVSRLARRGDLVLTLGAGDITELGPVLLRRLEERRA